MPLRDNYIDKRKPSPVLYISFACQLLNVVQSPFSFSSLSLSAVSLHHLSCSLSIPDFPAFPSAPPASMLGEDPPPYSPLGSPESSSAPVISCRVCQSFISVEGKIHQHVVKCGVCNEATVS